MSQADSRNTTNLPRRTLLAGLSGAVALAAVGKSLAAPAGEADPIFAVIDAHRPAFHAHKSAVLALDRMGSDVDQAARDVAEAALDQASDAEYFTASAIAETVPTTLAGALAAVEYVTGYYMGESEAFPGTSHELFCDSGDLITFIASIGEAISAVLDGSSDGA